MKATATISGIHVEINGTPEECWQFFKKETGFNEILGKIGEGSKRLAELQAEAMKPKLAIKYDKNVVDRQLWANDMLERGVIDAKTANELVNGKEAASAVEQIVKDMKPRKVCDPMARHQFGNCGGIDCPIYPWQVSNDGKTWADWPSEMCGRLGDYRYVRRRP